MLRYNPREYDPFDPGVRDGDGGGGRGGGAGTAGTGGVSVVLPTAAIPALRDPLAVKPPEAVTPTQPAYERDPHLHAKRARARFSQPSGSAGINL